MRLCQSLLSCSWVSAIAKLICSSYRVLIASFSSLNCSESSILSCSSRSANSLSHVFFTASEALQISCSGISAASSSLRASFKRLTKLFLLRDSLDAFDVIVSCTLRLSRATSSLSLLSSSVLHLSNRLRSSRLLMLLNIFSSASAVKGMIGECETIVSSMSSAWPRLESGPSGLKCLMISWSLMLYVCLTEFTASSASSRSW
mmetsp:Transcript_11477/g.22551  ORF Transcript_11477/g.22551 Transcript_11477/m.22551 type:complete len:203 (+) Transcript_11477:1635-2243(+)